MFDPEFYPCSLEAWQAMNADVYDKVVLDPSAGNGRLLDYANGAGAFRKIGVEKNDELRLLLANKFEVIGTDWFQVKKEDISHVQIILMNPPYSNADKHILHAWQIAPPGCEIISQCNAQTLENAYSGSRESLKSLIKEYGASDNVGAVYKNAERTTEIDIAIVRLFKPISTEEANFEGFYFDMPSENEISGVIRYNEIEALVSNYTGSIKCFDEFQATAWKLNRTARELNFNIDYSFRVSDKHNGISTTKEDFAKALQKSAWKEVFKKFNLEKFLTKGVMSDVNKFVESRYNYPFTMKNIFRMVEIVVGTSGHNMQRAIVEAIDNFTRHTDENRFSVEGWKTNAGHMLNKRFIAPSICQPRDHWDAPDKPCAINQWGHNFEYLQDLVKVLCYLSGKDYNSMMPYGEASLDAAHREAARLYREEKDAKGKREAYDRLPNGLSAFTNKFEPGQWYEWEFFRFRLYKKGSGHFEFINMDDWARLNQAYSNAKGNPLPDQTWKGFKKRTKKTEFSEEIF